MHVIECDSVVFDCDGVVLDSNRLKSDAFGQALEAYDPDQVLAFVKWHKATGGVSRYTKFERFFDDYVKVDNKEACIQGALDRFGEIVRHGLLNCDLIRGFEALARSVKTMGYPCSVNTGGDQTEVRSVFTQRGIINLFDVVYGSPTTKHSNMLKLVDEGKIRDKGIYFGDSQLDFALAVEFGMKFVFVRGKSEWAPNPDIFSGQDVLVVQDLSSIRLASC